MKHLTKPRMKSLWKGQVGNKYRVYYVYVDGKEFYHGENKASAKRQYDSALRFYEVINTNRITIGGKKMKRTYKVKNTKLNMLHTKVRNANTLGLITERDKHYNAYKLAGGKRSLGELLKRRPIAVYKD